jgi:protein NirF
MKRFALVAAFLVTPLFAAADELTATGDLGLVIERATGSLVLVDRSDRAAVGRIEGLGDLSHAS